MKSILIVEDTRSSRRLLELQLKKLGYPVQTASDGVEAWALIQKEQFNLIITDWVMPEMDGLELCRTIRAANLNHYVYIILLTIKEDKEDMITGFEAGADDFITKPCSPAELKVKIHTAHRVLRYEKDLLNKNRKLEAANENLAAAYHVIEESLISAARLYEALLPKPTQQFDQILFQSLFIPCEYVAGDMFNYFKLDKDRIAFYLLDVTGHGVPAAMTSFTLSHFLAPPRNPEDPSSHHLLNASEPVELAHTLNNLFLGESGVGRAFTIIFGIINPSKETIRFIQAGHPSPIYLPAEGQPRTIGDGGPPMGFFRDAHFDQYTCPFRPGDRIILYSDAIVECDNPEEQPYDMERLMTQAEQTRNVPLARSLNQIREDLENWSGIETFEDDFTLLGIEYQKP